MPPSPGLPITGATDDSAFTFRVNTAGACTGTIYNGTGTVTFSFTTAGAPASMTLVPASQTVLVGATDNLALTLLDANGKPTQPQTVDSVAITRSPTDDTLVNLATLAGGVRGLDDTSLQTGTGVFSLLTNPEGPGATTITATPLGTLPPAVTARTAVVTKSGTVSPVAVANMTVSAPVNAANTGTFNTGFLSRKATTPAGTSSVTVTIDDTPVAAAGNQIRVRAALTGTAATGSFLNGVAYTGFVYQTVTTDASKRASVTFTLGGTAILQGAILTIQQVTVANNTIGNSNITITQTQPAALVTTAPSGPVVAKVGASTPIAVEVDDSFGTPLVGWQVQLFRTAPGAATLIANTTTDSKGAASVTAVPLSTTVNNNFETYEVRSNPITGGTPVVSAPITITYTTSGNITSLTVGQVPGTPASFSNTAPTITTAPQILIASGGSGLTGLVGGASTSTFTVATGVATGTGTLGGYSVFTPDTNPGNPITVTVPAGVKVSSTIPGPTTLYSGGAQSVTVADQAPVYIWATKTGTHDVTFASGGLTVTGKVKVINAVTDAYNVTVDKAEQTLAPVAIGRTEVSVTDMFGNPVAGGSLGTPLASGVATGDVLFGGYTNSANVITGVDGKSSVVVIAGPSGSGVVTFTLNSGNSSAGLPTYAPPTGIAAPKLTAVQLIKIGSAPADKSITITGSRTTVSGKPGIKIDGVVTGIDNGKTVIPYFRFPGETTFAEGTARPVISDGSFTWQRKTGKKFYAYVTSDDGVVKSNRVIIAAN